MGSSSGSSTTQTSGLPSEFMPYVHGYLNQASQVAQLPYQQYNGPRVAELSPLQRQTMQGHAGLLSDPQWGRASQTVSDLQSGSMSPYMDQVGNRIKSQVTDQYNQATAGTRANFNDPGNFGGTNFQVAQDRNDKNLATGLTDGLATAYNNEWNNMQGRRANAVGLGAGLASTYGGLLNGSMQAGGVQRGFDQQVMDTLYQDWQRAQNYPQQQLGIFGNAISPLFGGTFKQTTEQGPGADRTAQVLGLLASMYGG